MRESVRFVLVGVIVSLAISGVLATATGILDVGADRRTPTAEHALADGANTWFSGRLVATSDDTLTVRVGENVSLSTTHAALFVQEDGGWVSVESWDEAQRGQRVCVNAHWHGNTSTWHVVKGFANSTCSPTPGE